MYACAPRMARADRRRARKPRRSRRARRGTTQSRSQLASNQRSAISRRQPRAAQAFRLTVCRWAFSRLLLSGAAPPGRRMRSDSLAGLQAELTDSECLQGLRLRLADARGLAHPPCDQAVGIHRAKLLEQELELLFELPTQRAPRRLRQRPHVLLERPPQLLARLVDELLVGVLLASLIGEMRAAIGVHLRLEVLGEGAAVEQDVLEFRRQVHFDGARFGELVEVLRR